jgi:hypothetical protein
MCTFHYWHMFYVNHGQVTNMASCTEHPIVTKPCTEARPKTLNYLFYSSRIMSCGTHYLEHRIGDVSRI